MYAIHGPKPAGDAVNFDVVEHTQYCSPHDWPYAAPPDGDAVNFELTWLCGLEREIVINIDGEGTTDPPEGKHTVTLSDIELEAIPEPGWEFNYWSSDTSAITFSDETSAKTTATVDSCGEITAHFNQNEWTIIINEGVGGTSDPSPGKYTYSFGEYCYFEALSDAGYSFSHWDGPYPIPFGDTVSGTDYRENIDDGITVTGTSVIASDDVDAEVIFDEWENYPNMNGEWELVDIDGANVIRTTQNTNFTGFWYETDAGKIEITTLMGVTEETDDDWIGITFRMNKYEPDQPENPYEGDIDAYDMYFFCLHGINGTNCRHGGFYKLEKAPYPNDTVGHRLWTGPWTDGVWKDGIVYFRQEGSDTPVQDDFYTDPSEPWPEDAKGRIVPLQKPFTEDLVWQYNEWYDVKIVAEGNEIKVWVDDTLEVDFADSTNVIFSGGYGPFTASQAYGSFKDFYVEAEADEKIEEIEITPYFEEEEYTLDISIEGEGTVGRIPFEDTYSYGEEVILYADPDEDWEFSHWEGDLSGSNPEPSLVMDRNKSVTAVFEASYTLEVIIDGEGSVDIDPDRESYGDGDTVWLEASADSGWEFSHWEDDLSGENESASLTMTKNKIVTAVFEAKEHELIVEIVGEGDVEFVPYKETYEHNERIELEAISIHGNYFSHWEDGLSGEDPEQTLIIQDDTLVTAVFKEHYTLETDIEGEGSVEVDPDREHYMPETEVELRARPDYGWAFDRWEGDVEDSDSTSTSIVLNDHEEVTAIFAEQVRLYTYVEGQGRIDVEPDQTYFTSGTEVTISPVAYPGWEFDRWEGDFETQDEEIVFTIEEDTKVIAVFHGRYTLDITVEGKGGVDVDPDEDYYEHGTEITVEAEPYNE